MNIYVQDDLAAQVKAIEEINVSAVCQTALRDEVDRRTFLAGLDRRMDRVQVDASTTHNSNVAFIGREIAEHDHRYGGQQLTAYLTAQGRIAIFSDDAQSLWVFDSFEELASDPVWADGEPKFLSEIADELGERHVIELDI